MKVFNIFTIALLVVVACFAMRSNAGVVESEVSQDAAKFRAMQMLLDPKFDFRSNQHTCDLFSMWNIGHSACAAQCIIQGKKGGFCNDKAVCICKD
ncbi:defensin-2-like [Haematobia irritans]|uniref:Putative defensin-2 n=1 Tax=Haematobia irritans TaxID=7368 RepID=A0A1L8EG77_HAEIR